VDRPDDNEEGEHLDDDGRAEVVSPEDVAHGGMGDDRQPGGGREIQEEDVFEGGVVHPRGDLGVLGGRLFPQGRGDGESERLGRDDTEVRDLPGEGVEGHRGRRREHADEDRVEAAVDDQARPRRGRRDAVLDDAPE